MTDEKDLPSSAADIQRKIKDAFDIFDHEGNRTVDVRELGTIVRSLNCCPTEEDLNDILTVVEEEEPTGYIRYEKFEQEMLKTLLERKFRPATEEQLMSAFQVLDPEGKGHINVDDMQTFMTEEGESFTPEEIEEMLSAAVDQDKGVIYYKDYVSLMVVDDDVI